MGFFLKRKKALGSPGTGLVDLNWVEMLWHDIKQVVYALKLSITTELKLFLI